MNWTGLKSYIIRNAEIQDSLDSYLDESDNLKKSSSAKKRNKERIIIDNDNCQQVLIENFEYNSISKENKVKPDVYNELNNDNQSDLFEYGLKIDEDNRRNEMYNSDDKKSLKEIAV
jgi:hypothetical protein